MWAGGWVARGCVRPSPVSPSPHCHPSAEVPQREEAAGFCHGRQLTSLNNENPRTPPPPRKQARTSGGESWDPPPCALGHELTCAPS